MQARFCEPEFYKVLAWLQVHEIICTISKSVVVSSHGYAAYAAGLHFPSSALIGPMHQAPGFKTCPLQDVRKAVKEYVSGVAPGLTKGAPLLVDDDQEDGEELADDKLG